MRTCADGSEVREGDEDGSGAHERVISQRPGRHLAHTHRRTDRKVGQGPGQVCRASKWRDLGEVGQQQGQRLVQAGRAHVQPLLQVELLALRPQAALT